MKFYYKHCVPGIVWALSSCHENAFTAATAASILIRIVIDAAWASSCLYEIVSCLYEIVSFFFLPPRLAAVTRFHIVHWFLVSYTNYPWNLECFLEDLFLGGQSSITQAFRRLSVKSLPSKACGRLGLKQNAFHNF